MLSATERRLLWLLESREGVSSLLDYVPRASPGFQPPHHLTRLADAFLRAETEPVRACVHTPPRHGKSLSILAFCVRYLARFPTHRIAYVTYQQGLANEMSDKAMRMAANTGLSLAKANQASWTTHEGGAFYFTSVVGPLVGRGVNLLVIDDPIKDRAQAESQRVREGLSSWFHSAALSRLEPGGSVIVVHQRWRSDDLIGELIKDDDYDDITLAAVQQDGTPLWPARYSADELEKIRLEVGSREWAALYQGCPLDAQGSLFVKDAARYQLSEVAEIKQGAKIAIGIDPAATAKGGDYSVIAVMAAKGLGLEQRWWLLELWRGQVAIPELVREIQRVQARYPGSTVHCEAVGGFKAVPQTLSAIDPNLRVYEAPVAGDKYTRALPLAAAWERSAIMLPMSAPWLNPMLDEFRLFTGKGDVHDDQVDAVAHAFSSLKANRPAVRRNLPASIAY